MIPDKTLRELQDAPKPCDLRRITFPSGLRLLVLAPHPDDFDQIAVSLKHFQRCGVELNLLVLTGASSGVQDSFVDPPTREQKEVVREQEQRAALDYFGLPQESVTFLFLRKDQDGDILRSASSRKAVQAHVTAFDPDIVALPYGNDPNTAHQQTFALFTEIAEAWEKPLLALYIRDPKTIAMRMDAYVAFDEEAAAWKGEMLRFHQSQHTRNLATRNYGIDERILRVNRAIASELGLTQSYAEGFQLAVFGTPQRT